MTLNSKLKTIFGQISLEFCDSDAIKILESQEIKKISDLYPAWRILIDKGLEFDKEETYRTLRHIFRSLWMYYSLTDNKIDLGIKSNYMTLLREDIKEICGINSDLFPLILLLHDIGRPFNKEWHTNESAKLVEERSLLKESNLNLEQKLIILGSIKYHLLPGTIYTGESNYTGAISLLKDNALKEIWKSQETISLLFKILNIFTIIDILGYDYSKIFNHYFEYYYQIKDNLIKAYSFIIVRQSRENEDKLYDYLSDLDQTHLKWRIACSLRIFQFIRTAPHLTEDFYYNIIDEGLKELNLSWSDYSRSLGKEHALIQLKYALPIMMVLASNTFKREPINENERINTRIFKFWETIIKVLKSFHEIGNNNHIIWNVVFQLPWRWFLNEKYLSYILSNDFLEKIGNEKPIFNKELNCYLLTIRVEP